VGARLPKARIGFFLHVPFPNPEIFLTLPVRDWLVKGLLGADLIGFHTRRYRGHFTAVLRRLFGLEMDAVKKLNQAIALCVAEGDNTSRELLEEILESEEDHVDWLETQLGLIKTLGESAYLAEQMHK